MRRTENTPQSTSTKHSSETGDKFRRVIIHSTFYFTIISPQSCMFKAVDSFWKLDVMRTDPGILKIGNPFLYCARAWCISVPAYLCQPASTGSRQAAYTPSSMARLSPAPWQARALGRTAREVSAYWPGRPFYAGCTGNFPFKGNSNKYPSANDSVLQSSSLLPACCSPFQSKTDPAGAVCRRAK